MALISGMPGGAEVLLILFIILLLFGAKKLPELSRSLGKSLGEFKKGKEDLEKEIRDLQNEVHEETITSEPEPAAESAEDLSETEEPPKAPLSED
jgi:sec-independent protein translocase protein TatA